MKDDFLCFSVCLAILSECLSCRSLCSLETRAESVLLPLYFSCLAFEAPSRSVFLKLAARPMLVTICCWRSCRERWWALRRPELTAAACSCVSSISWWIRDRQVKRRSTLRRSCFRPAFNNLEKINVIHYLQKI